MSGQLSMFPIELQRVSKLVDAEDETVDIGVHWQYPYPLTTRCRRFGNKWEWGDSLSRLSSSTIKVFNILRGSWAFISFVRVVDRPNEWIEFGEWLSTQRWVGTHDGRKKSLNIQCPESYWRILSIRIGRDALRKHGRDLSKRWMSRYMHVVMRDWDKYVNSSNERNRRTDATALLKSPRPVFNSLGIYFFAVVCLCCMVKCLTKRSYPWRNRSKRL